MRRIAIIIGLAGVLGLTAPALAQAPVPAASPARSADPGVLFWTPERREADFRRMGEIAPHATVAASGSPRPLMQGEPLDLDVEAFMQWRSGPPGFW